MIISTKNANVLVRSEILTANEDDLSDNGFPDKEEGEIPNFNINEEEEYVKNTQWTEGVEIDNSGKNQEMPYSEHHHSPKVNSEVPKEDSNSFSKPPGFEAYNSSSKISSSRKNHVSPKQPSHFSSAPAKTSRVSKSQSKPLNNHGSMIEAFVSYIEMGKVLGYDMEGSKKDLKKFIDSLGVNQVNLRCKLNVQANGVQNNFEKAFNSISGLPQFSYFIDIDQCMEGLHVANEDANALGLL
ncbi:hypothetical protein Tco_0936487 [Tanacetum coccineum]